MFTKSEILVLILAGIILVCGAIIAIIWIAECVMYVINADQTDGDDIDDTREFAWMNPDKNTEEE